MKQVLLSGKGAISVEDVPVPAPPPGSILVRNEFSLISAGTEGAAVAKHPGWFGVWEKARRSPRNVKRVLELARAQGPAAAWEVVQAKLGDVAPVGYSSAGRVVEVGGTDAPFADGDRVACMGTGYACHAEYVTVPYNLAVRVPANVPTDEASFAALGCIAMQGIRRLELGAGAWVGVIGLGLIGQITVRLLRAMGYEAIGFDLLESRVRMAKEIRGVDARVATPDAARRLAMSATDGRGLDGVLVTAAARNSAPTNLALDLCGHHGRVVVVGDVGMDVARDKMYRKELEVRLSCSYGPGRYDPEYEEGGHDYPIGHVRWTERRNLEFLLRLMADGRIELRGLINARFGLDNASEAYALVKSQDPAVFGVVFEYPAQDTPNLARERTMRPAAAPAVVRSGLVRLGIIGTGGYARAVHIPNLRRLKDAYQVVAVASRTGASAAVVGRELQASMITSDYEAILEREDVDAVLIATRHTSHARITLDALRAGKHVFVEKPMATTVEDCQAIVQGVDEAGVVLRVGFNRRFSPMLRAMRDAMPATVPRMLSVRVNVASGADHWSASREEGGRIVGEGVHFFDYCNWMVGEEPASVISQTSGGPEVTNANAEIVMKYPDGSVARICYTTVGHRGLGKECFEALSGGCAARCDDYKRLEVYGAGDSKVRPRRGDKGQRLALQDFAAIIRGDRNKSEGADARAGLCATLIAHAAHASAISGCSVILTP